MAKTLCDWSKGEIEHHASKLARLVQNPTYFCRKCARVANTNKILCKAHPLPPVHDAKESEDEHH